jgi:hypothetical protein
MRRKRHVPLATVLAAAIGSALLIWAGSACRDHGHIRSFPVGSASCREIRIVERAGSMAADALAVVDANGKLILPPLPQELAQIQDILISPNKDLALVISVGEGHPWINVYRIADWLEPLPPGNEGVEPIRSMDPYPFDWTDVAWSGPQEVRFRSAGDYSLFDRTARRPGGELGAPVKPWIWDTETDAVRSE